MMTGNDIRKTRKSVNQSRFDLIRGACILNAMPVDDMYYLKVCATDIVEALNFQAYCVLGFCTLLHLSINIFDDVALLGRIHMLK